MVSTPNLIDCAEEHEEVRGTLEYHESTGSSKSDPVEIRICLGSSCFARGNSENLAILEKYIQSHGSNASVRLTGKLCQDRCKEGPNLMIGGKLHHGVTAARLRELLQQLGRPSREAHEAV
jgi:NADH:ubiquinone oxidoreductase subunit E